MQGNREEGPAEQTPNLAAVLTEVFARADWASNNALSFIPGWNLSCKGIRPNGILVRVFALLFLNLIWIGLDDVFYCFQFRREFRFFAGRHSVPESA